MRISKIRALIALVVGWTFVFGMGAGARAEGTPGATTGEAGWHVVRPGETLESITDFYLGSIARWRENWRLNPELSDPDRIFPGQRLKVLLPVRLPAHSARLLKTSRGVEDQLRPSPWIDAWQDDLLLPKDGVRTFERSSAELTFADDTRLVLTEQSLVFLGSGEPVRQKVDRRSIEIVEGQADLEAFEGRPVAGDIEIVLGEATARPKPGPSGSLQTRARLPEAGGAQLMVYGGQSELEAAGKKMDVPEGMGSTVPEGAAPSPPEKLLPAPRAEEPRASMIVARAGLELRWAPVDGASSYTVEICRDPRCTELVDKAKGLRDAAWQPTAELPLGRFHWRVTAISPSGLDGYPSSAEPFELVEKVAAFEPPETNLVFRGPQASCGERLVVGPGVELALDSSMDLKQIASWTPLLDGEPKVGDAWAAALTAGEHTAGAILVDGAGREWRAEPIAFVYDPEPPSLIWGAADGAELGRASGLPAETAAWSGTPSTSSGAADDIDLEWRSESSDWMPLGGRRWHFFADKPWLMTWGERGWLRKVRQGWKIPFERSRIELRGGDFSFLEAREDVCRVERMSFRLTGKRKTPRALIVEAIDSVGNRTRLEWPLRATGSGD